MSWPYKTVLMVGCTAGLGIAMAERMIENGSFVIAVGRRMDRLEEFRNKHGDDKVAVSVFDITDLDAIGSWAEGIIKTHPTLDCVVLNAGIQRGIDFTRAHLIDLSLVRQELDTNYTAQISLCAAFLPHLQSLAPNPCALVTVSSGLALVPMPRCANYCATKAGLRALVWCMRAQLAADEKSRHVRVVEIVPPAVKTELHKLQKDVVEAGLSDIGITIDEYMRDCWKGLVNGDEEILIGPIAKHFSHVDDVKREIFTNFLTTGSRTDG
ncbi:short chain dehydrogenase [Poronia punctata]|nr:short chain dehydrogenase [Poronia punctata]